ncbi:MAG TPA: TM0106 family RecB-like putative nuclease, partial [Candidatus Krumholzibacteria bacterium]|nr:TM0106 family RecB-like putative nuclease [Candidatus Krumholzibacteria bacterium]
AGLTLPLTPKPARGSMEGYARVRDQARVQLEGREQKKPVHEMLPVKPGEGLTRLPEPSRGDLFLDLEGDPFIGDGGREYLFGVIALGAEKQLDYDARWAFTPAEERVAFEAVIDRIIAAWDKDPNMHVYHYGGYEPGAMKRLMGRYATREAEVDRLLRGERFVDLLTIVKQSLRASVESYSIKKLEPFYGFEREMDLRKAGDTRAVMERCLELNNAAKITDDDRNIVAAYNRDDCVSTLRLRDWMEGLRAELVRGGETIARPVPKEDEPSEKATERDERIQKLIARLTDGVPDDRTARTPEEHARWLLAHMLDFHRREDKVVWWEFFALRDMEEDGWIEAEQVICGLTFQKRLAMPKTSPLDRYTYPEQPCQVDVDDIVEDAEGKFGTVEAIDREARIIDIKKLGARAGDHPSRIFAYSRVPNGTLRDALERVATEIADNGIQSGGVLSAACSLLMREKPRLKGFPFAPAAGESTVDFAVRMGLHLDGSVLPIQGPPGSGKTYTGAHMICAMVKAGLRVGVTANSHSVILNLLQKVMEEAAAAKIDVCCGHKGSDSVVVPDGIEDYGQPRDAIAAMRSDEVNVLGGTAWLWANPESKALVDVLVVDEAGQMKLANVIAASGAANSIVLLGDPQQLGQPQRGSHPEGTEVSALAHLLEDPISPTREQRQVIPPDRGIFLPETWRMAPPICAFCSDAFYEG